MRQGQNNNNNNNNKNRMRGRNRGGGGGGGGKGPNPLTRSYESNGPDVKIRGTALHIAEKYIQLARDATSSGDRVAAESYFQHAEHYYRLVAAAQAQLPQPQQSAFRNDEEGDEDDERMPGTSGYGDRQFYRPGYGPGDPQPYSNGNGGSGGGNANANGDVQPDVDMAPPASPPIVQPGEEASPDQRASPDNRPGGFRSRRRRPYRERFGAGEGGQDAQPASQGGQPDRSEAPPGDD